MLLVYSQGDRNGPECPPESEHFTMGYLLGQCVQISIDEQADARERTLHGEFYPWLMGSDFK